MTAKSALASFRDLAPEEDDFMAEVVAGLEATPKSLPCKFFYDEAGSALFEEICELPEYYPTRTETALMRDKVGEMAAAIGPHAQIVEYGCGSIEKVRILLDALQAPAAYVAVDISREHLRQAAETLAADYPALEVHALCADFSRPFEVPDGISGDRRVGYFPGSTLGNFDHRAAESFLAEAARLAGSGGGMLIGIDLKKDEDVLNAAYNDAAGVTSAFNLNLLVRINRELGGDFAPGDFAHHAFYNAAEGRIEMHLVSGRAQEVRIGEHRFGFAKGETIHTENSYKYSVAEFQALASRAGFEPVEAWCDPAELFSVHYLSVP